LTIILSSLDSRAGKTKSRDDSGASGSVTPALAKEDEAELITPEAYRAKAKAKADKRAENARVFKERQAAAGASGKGADGSESSGRIEAADGLPVNEGNTT
jgi:hypothetical protein